MIREMVGQHHDPRAVQNASLSTQPEHETEFVMTFINRHLANLVAIAFGLTAAVAGVVLLTLSR